MSVSNKKMLVVSKFNKSETCQQKIITQITNERYVLVSSYFYTYISHLLGFDMDDMVSFDIKYFFVLEIESFALWIHSMCVYIYIYIYIYCIMC